MSTVAVHATEKPSRDARQDELQPIIDWANRQHEEAAGLYNTLKGRQYKNKPHIAALVASCKLALVREQLKDEQRRG